MNVTREEAAQALNDINRASDRAIKRRGYHHGAPFFILWGVVWLLANTASYFQPDMRGWIWFIAVVTGMVISTAMAFAQSRRLKAEPGTVDAQQGRNVAITSVITFAFVYCIVWIAEPQSSRQINAIISILFPFLYMVAGVWAGWRLFAIGLVTAAAIMVGYVWIEDYFDLWMGVFAGGSLIAGGVWLRTA